MINKHKAILFFLLALSMPCFAGGLKGNLIDDSTLKIIIVCIVLIHLASIMAYYGRIVWLRIVCGILYLPIFLVPLILSVFNAMFGILFIPPILFYAFIIVKKRK